MLLRMCERRYARCKDQARMMIESSLDQTLNACIIPWIVTTHIYFASAPNMMSQTKFWNNPAMTLNSDITWSKFPKSTQKLLLRVGG